MRSGSGKGDVAQSAPHFCHPGVDFRCRYVFRDGDLRMEKHFHRSALRRSGCETGGVGDTSPTLTRGSTSRPLDSYGEKGRNGSVDWRNESHRTLPVSSDGEGLPELRHAGLTGYRCPRQLPPISEDSDSSVTDSVRTSRPRALLAPAGLEGILQPARRRQAIFHLRHRICRLCFRRVQTVPPGESIHWFPLSLESPSTLVSLASWIGFHSERERRSVVDIVARRSDAGSCHSSRALGTPNPRLTRARDA